MAESNAVTETPVAAPSTGIAPSSGQGGDAATPETAKNPTAAPATPAGTSPEPSTPAPKYRFKDQHEAERAHSELQSRYSKLGDPEQASQQLALLNSLKADAKFREWAQARLAEQEAGSGDPETVKAMQVVESIADRKAREMMAPVVAQMAQARLAAVGQAMQREHGPEWLEAKPDMDAFYVKGVQAGVFAPQGNPYLNYEITNGLYKAVRGDQREAKAYQKKLEAKQATTTQSTPGLAPAATAEPPTKGVEGALRAAMKQHGLV